MIVIERTPVPTNPCMHCFPIKSANRGDAYRTWASSKPNCVVQRTALLPVSTRKTKPFTLCSCYRREERIHFETVERHYATFMAHLIRQRVTAIWLFQKFTPLTRDVIRLIAKTIDDDYIAYRFPHDLSCYGYTDNPQKLPVTKRQRDDELLENTGDVKKIKL